MKTPLLSHSVKRENSRSNTKERTGHREPGPQRGLRCPLLPFLPGPGAASLGLISVCSPPWPGLWDESYWLHPGASGSYAVSSCPQPRPPSSVACSDSAPFSGTPPPQVPSSRQPSCCLLPLCSRPQFSEAAMPKNCSLGLLRCPGMLSGEGSLEEVRGVCGKMMGAGRGGY